MQERLDPGKEGFFIVNKLNADSPYHLQASCQYFRQNWVNIFDIFRKKSKAILTKVNII